MPCILFFCFVFVLFFSEGSAISWWHPAIEWTDMFTVESRQTPGGGGAPKSCPLTRNWLGTSQQPKGLWLGGDNWGSCISNYIVLLGTDRVVIVLHAGFLNHQLPQELICNVLFCACIFRMDLMLDVSFRCESEADWPVIIGSLQIQPVKLLKLGSVMLFRNKFCYTGWNGPAILRVVNTWCIHVAEQSMLFGPTSRDWSDAFMCRSALCPSLLHTCTCYVSLAQMPEIFGSLLCRNTELQEKTFIWLMAEKMQPALLVTAHPAKKARKRKPEAEKAAKK